MYNQTADKIYNIKALNIKGKNVVPPPTLTPTLTPSPTPTPTITPTPTPTETSINTLGGSTNSLGEFVFLQENGYYILR